MSLPKGKPDARETYERIVAVRTSIKHQATSVRQAARNGSGQPQLYIGLHQFLVRLAPEWDQLKPTPGLQKYTVERENNPSIDVTAGYDQVLAAAFAASEWLRTNLISDGAGRYAMWRLDPDAGFVPIIYSAEQMAGLVPLLDDLLTVVG